MGSKNSRRTVRDAPIVPTMSREQAEQLVARLSRLRASGAFPAPTPTSHKRPSASAQRREIADVESHVQLVDGLADLLDAAAHALVEINRADRRAAKAAVHGDTARQRVALRTQARVTRRYERLLRQATALGHPARAVRTLVLRRVEALGERHDGKVPAARTCDCCGAPQLQGANRGRCKSCGRMSCPTCRVVSVRGLVCRICAQGG